MDKHQSPIEEQFKKAFESFELPVSDADFSAIERKLASQNHKKRFGWWFFLLLVPVSILTWYVKEKASLPGVSAPGTIQSVNSPLSESQVSEQQKVPVELSKKISGLSGGESEAYTSNTGNKRKILNTPKRFTAKTIQAADELPYKGLSELEQLKLFPKRHKGFDTLDLPPEWLANISKTLRIGPSVPDHHASPWQVSMRLGAGESRPVWLNAESDQNLLNYRKSNEKTSQYSEIALLTSWQKNGWRTQSGIGYQELQTQSSAFKWQLFDSIPVLNPQGDTLGYFRFNYRDTTSSGSWQNAYRYVSIPLNISKSIALNGKNSLIVGTGINFQLLTEVSGQYLQSPDKIAPLKKDVLSRGLTQWNLSLGYERELSQNLAFLISLQYQEPFRGIEFKDQDLGLKLRQSGLYIQFNYKIPNYKRP